MNTQHLNLVSNDHKLAATITTPVSDYAVGLLRIGGGANLPHWPNTWQEHLTGQGIASMAFDFAGVGESEGSIENTNLNSRYADSLEAYKLFCDETGLNAEQIYVMGVSMGAPLAIKLTYDKEAKGVVLASPAAYPKEAWDKDFGESFSRAIRRFEAWKSSVEFERLKSYEGAVMFAYGSRDEVIPRPILKSYTEITESKQGEVVELDAAHTFLREESEEVSANNEFWLKLEEFIKSW